MFGLALREHGRGRAAHDAHKHVAQKTLQFGEPRPDGRAPLVAATRPACDLAYNLLHKDVDELGREQFVRNAGAASSTQDTFRTRPAFAIAQR